jgi:hypothetical protein
VSGSRQMELLKNASLNETIHHAFFTILFGSEQLQFQVDVVLIAYYMFNEQNSAL